MHCTARVFSKNGVHLRLSVRKECCFSLGSMEPAGLTLGVLAEIRYTCSSIIVRIARFRNAPARFANVSESVTRLIGTVHDISAIGTENFALFPTEIVRLFSSWLVAVKDTLFKMEKKLVECDIGATSGFFLFARANACTETIAGIEQNAKEAEAKLQLLLLQLTVILTGNKVGVGLVAAEEKSMMSDVYFPGNNAPPLRYASGYPLGGDKNTFVSFSDIFKSHLLSSSVFNSGTVTIHPRTSDIGKEKVLLGLAGDTQVRDRFPGGIIYLVLGPNSSRRSILSELARGMRATGAEARASAVERMNSLSDGISAAAMWFRCKSCLFLVSDIISSETKKADVVLQVQNMLQGLTESRVVLSSRFQSPIAGTGYTAAPLGPLASSILFALLRFGKSSFAENVAVKAILVERQAYPLALSLTGSAVGFLARWGSDFKYCCRQYLEDIQSEGRTGAAVHNLISVNIRYLEDDFQNLVHAAGVKPSFFRSIADLYSSLCVFKFWEVVSFSTLSQLWDVEEYVAEAVGKLLSSTCLVFLAWDAEERRLAGLFLHDDHLNYCRQLAVGSEQD